MPSSFFFSEKQKIFFIYFLFLSDEEEEANARNVRPYYPYWQYTDLFIFRYIYIHNNYIHSYTQQYIAYLQVQYIAIQSNTQLQCIHNSAVRRSAGGRSSAGASGTFWSDKPERNFFQLRLENENDKKYDNFDKICSQIMVILNLLNVHIMVWSLICWVRPLSTTTNGQITIIYYVYKHHASMRCVTSCYFALRR